MNKYLNRFLFVLFVFHLPGSLSIQAQDLFVGLSEINITPRVGYPQYRGISTGVHDTLYAKAIYFRQGDQEAGLVECDRLWVGRFVSADVRLEADQRTGIGCENMIIEGTTSDTRAASRGTT